MIQLKLALCLFLFLSSAVAQAEELVPSQPTAPNKRERSGWYVGGGIGGTQVELKDRAFDLDESEVLFSVVGGYEFENWIALEGTLFVTGDLDNGQNELDSAGLLGMGVAPRFSLNITPLFSTYVKLGLAFIAYSESYDDDGGIFDTADETLYWRGFVPMVGIGAQLNTNAGITIRFAYDYYSGELNEEDDDSDYYNGPIVDRDLDLNNYSLMVYYRF